MISQKTPTITAVLTTACQSTGRVWQTVINHFASQSVIENMERILETVPVCKTVPTGVLVQITPVLRPQLAPQKLKQLRPRLLLGPKKRKLLFLFSIAIADHGSQLRILDTDNTFSYWLNQLNLEF